MNTLEKRRLKTGRTYSFIHRLSFEANGAQMNQNVNWPIFRQRQAINIAMLVSHFFLNL